MRTEEQMVAYALETEVELLPFIPELLADLEELGSDSEVVAEVIEELDLPNDARVVDLGCGKGATALEIADELGLEVVGVELFEPFVDACNELARKRDLGNKCTFVHGDIVKLAGQLPPADVAIFAALGDVIGRLDTTINIIREYVRPGGFLVISDSFIASGGSTDFPGFEQYAEHDETIRRLTSCGDRLIREVLEEEFDDDESDLDEDALIAARAETIALRHPEIASAVREFAASQAAENAYIASNLCGAIWVLERR